MSRDCNGVQILVGDTVRYVRDIDDPSNRYTVGSIDENGWVQLKETPFDWLIRPTDLQVIEDAKDS